MKKMLSLMMALVLICSCIALPASAQETEEVVVENEYGSDIGYFVTVIEESPSLLRAGGTKSGAKSATYYTSTGVAQFTVKVTATFSYNGTSATATSVTGSTTYHVTGCSLISSSKSMSGNSATATATIHCNGRDVKKSLTLYCSGSGVLS